MLTVGNLGRQVKRLRSSFGLTQEALAKRAGVPQHAISRLENGVSNPRMDTLAKIATSLGTQVSLETDGANVAGYLAPIMNERYRMDKPLKPPEMLRGQLSARRANLYKKVEVVA